MEIIGLLIMAMALLAPVLLWGFFIIGVLVEEPILIPFFLFGVVFVGLMFLGVLMS